MKKYILFLLCFGFLYSCTETPYINAEAESESTRSTVIVNNNYLEMSLSIPNDTLSQNEILIKGTVIEDKEFTPISGAKIRVVGTDTPGNSTMSNAEGQYEILLPIVHQTKSDVMTFVFEVQKESVKQFVIAEILENEYIQMFGIPYPSTYKVAYAGILNVARDRCGCTLTCNLPLTKE